MANHILTFLKNARKQISHTKELCVCVCKCIFPIFLASWKPFCVPGAPWHEGQPRQTFGVYSRSWCRGRGLCRALWDSSTHSSWTHPEQAHPSVPVVPPEGAAPCVTGSCDTGTQLVHTPRGMAHLTAPSGWLIQTNQSPTDKKTTLSKVATGPHVFTSPFYLRLCQLHHFTF